MIEQVGVDGIDDKFDCGCFVDCISFSLSIVNDGNRSVVDGVCLSDVVDDAGSDDDVIDAICDENVDGDSDDGLNCELIDDD